MTGIQSELCSLETDVLCEFAKQLIKRDWLRTFSMFKRKARKIVKCWFKSWRYQPRWSLTGFVMRYLEMGEQQAEHIRIPTFPHIVTALLWGKPMKYGINPESRYWLSVCKWEASKEGALRRLWIWENIFFGCTQNTPKKWKKQGRNLPTEVWIPCSVSIFGNIFFGATRQQVAPKKISGLKTQKPQRFLGFFMPIFKVEFKRYHFPKSTFGEDLN